MKVIDAVNLSIANYPTLYLAPTYEESKRAVLHHLFIVLGNGIEWANTKDPKKGGYLTSPEYRRMKNDEYKRKIDRPYGKEKHPLDPRFFTENCYEFAPIDTKLSPIFKVLGAWRDLNRNEKDEILFEQELSTRKDWVLCGTKDYPDTTKYVAELIDKKVRDRDPYPNFSKQYSCFWEPGVEYIQPDWLDAAIEHLEYWVTYFNDDKRSEEYHYRYNANTIKDVIKLAKEQAEKVGKDWVTVLHKEWEWPSFDPAKTNKENANDHWYNKELPKTTKFLKETLEKLYKIKKK